jgi:hypothetical protein
LQNKPIECPVCGYTQHAQLPNQAGKQKCLRCGCVHAGKLTAVPPVTTPVRPAPPPARPALAKPGPPPMKPPDAPAAGPPAANTQAVECPVCGTPGYLPIPYVGDPIRCRQCGCVHRA